jgi:hypothetical protein
VDVAPARHYFKRMDSLYIDPTRILTVRQPDGSVEEHFVCAYRELDHRVLRDARKYTSPGYDLAAELEKLDDSNDRRMDHRRREQSGEIGERLAHALRTDLGEKRNF